MQPNALNIFVGLAEGGGFDPLAVDPGAMVLTLITFLGLFFILAKFAWGPILQGVEAREKRIDDAITSAESDREKAQTLLTDYEQRVKNVESEVAEMREKGRSEAEAMRQDILAKANADALAVSDKAQRDIELARNQALEDIRKESVSLGLAIAGKVVGRSVDDDDQKRLAEQVVAEVGSVSGGA